MTAGPIQRRAMEREGFEPSKAYAGRFTVCSLWPLGYLSSDEADCQPMIGIEPTTY